MFFVDETGSTDWSRRWLTGNSKMSTSTILFEFLFSLIDYSLDEQQIQKKNRRRGWKMFDVIRCRLEMDCWMSGWGGASDSVSTRRGMKRRGDIWGDIGDAARRGRGRRGGLWLVWKSAGAVATPRVIWQLWLTPTRRMTTGYIGKSLLQGEVKVELTIWEWGNELFDNFDRRPFSFLQFIINAQAVPTPSYHAPEPY